VPYLSQNDGATGQGSRMCFASTCAMAAAFLKPGCFKGSGQLDDQFLASVQRHGDTTDITAQVATLQSLGLHALASARMAASNTWWSKSTGEFRTRWVGCTKVEPQHPVAAATGAW
jgi:hypothetical protein